MASGNAQKETTLRGGLQNLTFFIMVFKRKRLLQNISLCYEQAIWDRKLRGKIRKIEEKNVQFSECGNLGQWFIILVVFGVQRGGLQIKCVLGARRSAQRNLTCQPLITFFSHNFFQKQRANKRYFFDWTKAACALKDQKQPYVFIQGEWTVLQKNAKIYLAFMS